MKWVKIGVCCASILEAACTSNPKNITPDYVSPRLYSAFDCEELFAEKRKIQAKVDDLIRRQKSNRTTDTVATTVGIVILWPALLALSFTKDRKREISRYMGEDEAIQENIETKKCAYPGALNGETAKSAAPENAAQPELRSARDLEVEPQQETVPQTTPAPANNEGSAEAIR